MDRLISFLLFIALLSVVIYLVYELNTRQRDKEKGSINHHNLTTDHKYNYPYETYHSFSEIIDVNLMYVPFMFNVLEQFRPWIIHAAFVYPSGKREKGAMLKPPYYLITTKNSGGLIFNLIPRVGDVKLSFIPPKVNANANGVSAIDTNEHYVLNAYWEGSKVQNGTLTAVADLIVIPYKYGITKDMCVVYAFCCKSNYEDFAETIADAFPVEMMAGVLNFILEDITNRKVKYFIITGSGETSSTYWSYLVDKLYNSLAIHISPRPKNNYILDCFATKTYGAQTFMLVSKTFAEPEWGMIYPEWTNPPIYDLGGKSDLSINYGLRAGIVCEDETDASHRQELHDRSKPYTDFVFTDFNDRRPHLSAEPEPDHVDPTELTLVNFNFVMPFASE